jgi:hypothetical protein
VEVEIAIKYAYWAKEWAGNWALISRVSEVGFMLIEINPGRLAAYSGNLFS